MDFFINKYVVDKIYGKPIPVPYDEVFTSGDFIEKPDFVKEDKK